MAVQSSGGPGGPEEDPVIPDEVWRKFEEDSERDIRRSEAPKEPSARARMVAERLRRLDEEAERQRTEGLSRRRRRRERKDPDRHGGPAEPWRPDGWRAAPDGPRADPRGERRRRVLSVVIVIGGMALLIVLLSPYRFWAW
ncbi:hypothetical protein [Streptomyces sp. NPDC059009]|uniref:hypothetical protein n=1 Tax=Streptomyces sp. NPDC059009 TaxID=3346694 RepID=UPI0036BC5FD5